MKKILFLVLLLKMHSLYAQNKPATTTKNLTVTVGYFNYDSILKLMPGYQKSLDSSLTNYYSHVKTDEQEIERKENEYDSLKSTWSPLIRSLKEKEITDLQKNLENLKANKSKYVNEAYFDSYDIRLTDAAKKISLAKGYVAVLDTNKSDDFVLWAGPGINFVDVTKDISTEVGIQ